MTNISTYPLIDDFETTLAQERDWATGTVYVNSVPAITFPASTTTHITVNPWKTTQQTAVINALDSSAKTLTVSSISVNKWASLAYTQQTHWVGSIVRISIPYAFIAALVAALNTKIDGLVQWVYFYADEATRNAALWASPATDWLVTWLTTESKIQYSLAWSRLDWSTTSSTFNNSSTTVAGKVEMATTAESKAWTDTGWTWALTVVSPSDIAANQQSGTFVYAWASATGNDSYSVALVPAIASYTTWMRISFKTDVANTGACALDVCTVASTAIKTIAWNDPESGRLPAWAIIEVVYDGTYWVLQNPPEKATQAQVTAVSDDLTYVTPLWLKPDLATPTTRVGNTADWTVTYSHTLGRSPRKILFFGMTTSWTTIGWYVSGKNYSIRSTPWSDNDRCMSVTDWWWTYYASVTAVSTTNFTLTRTKSGTPSTTLHFFASVE